MNRDEPEDDVAAIMRRQDVEERIKSKPVDRQEMQNRYNIAIAAKVSAMIKCPTCGKEHMKSAYNKVFCSNHRTAGNRNCKDRYWNIVTDKDALRASTYCK
jgi:hypothetical protein